MYSEELETRLMLAEEKIKYFSGNGNKNLGTEDIKTTSKVRTKLKFITSSGRKNNHI